MMIVDVVIDTKIVKAVDNLVGVQNRLHFSIALDNRDHWIWRMYQYVLIVRMIQILTF